MKEQWLLGPKSITWEMCRERALLVGGGRALVLQAAHPLVGEGIHQHSGFQTDPWRRLQRTSDFYLGLVYAKQDELEAFNRWLEHAHRGVKGQTAQGETYSADRPDLMLWVQATLADSVAWAWQQIWGPLPPEKLELYWQEQILIGEAIGIEMTQLPDNWDGFQKWFGRQCQGLQPTAASGSVLEHLHDLPVALPGIPVVLWQAGLPLGRSVSRQALAAGLPEPLRSRMGISWTAERQGAWNRTCRQLRVALRLIPSRIRHSKHARQALQSAMLPN
jgi:uncharacterized protein (DUF2236 family)